MDDGHTIPVAPGLTMSQFSTGGVMKMLLLALLMMMIMIEVMVVGVVMVVVVVAVVVAVMIGVFFISKDSRKLKLFVDVHD